MARRRYRKNENLLALAARSDWKFSALIAAACVFGGVILVPAFFRSPILAPLGGMFSALAWIFAFAFAAIAVARWLKTHPTLATTARRTEPLERPPVHSPLPPGEGPGERATAAQHVPTPTTPPPPETWSLDVLERIEWKRFEDLCCAFYREKGIRAETTQLGPDGGIDIRLFQDETDPARVTAIVQCKAWNQLVGVKPVRELRGVMAHVKAEKAFFMAPKGFTEEARAFARENRITLLDGALFLAMLQRLPEASSKRLLEFATAGDWTTPTCPSCGERMTARHSKRGPFWGCTTYPKCRGMLPMRANAAA